MSDAQRRLQKKKENETNRKLEKENSSEKVGYKTNSNSLKLIFNKFDKDLNDVL